MGINLLQKLVERKQYQQRQLWGEKWAAPCQEWHEQQNQCQSEMLTDSDKPSYWQESSDVIWWCRRLESKGCRMPKEVANQFKCWHLGSQRYRCKKCPSLVLQFMRPNARGKLQFRSIRNSTNQVEKPRLIQGCVQLWCLDGINKYGIPALFKVSNSLV